ncbi:zinc finger protein 233-like isoform X2 [Sus scrofa]|uniref:zinc finger protein 233-like isoform X2 n=1 Tax=Sus scrofa TaxID=9823 RepID=UPI000A2B2F7B|nr:zinc finger protein 233-like isoform X2 [Sus scrofa]
MLIGAFPGLCPSPQRAGETDQVPGHRNRNETERLQEGGLRHLLPEDLMRWQTQEQFTGKVIRTPDSIVRLQGKTSTLLQQDDSPCRVWAGEPAQAPEDGNYAVKLQGGPFQQYRPSGVSSSDLLGFLEEDVSERIQTYPSRCQQIAVTSNLSKCDHCNTRRISHPHCNEERRKSRKPCGHITEKAS